MADLSFAGEELRLFVDGTAGFGHQASSLLVLESLVGEPASGGLGYRGRIAIVYTGGDETRKKLVQLVPRLAGTRRGVSIGEATVALVPVERVSSLPTAALGLTGGADGVGHRFAELAGTRAFLRLQPYRWADIWPPLADEIQFAGGSERDVPLAELPEVGTRFAERSFHVRVPAAPAFGGAVLGDHPRDRALATLLDAADTGRVRTWPVYGIRTTRPELRRPAADMLFTLCCAALLHQDAGFGAPIVVMVLDHVQPDAPERPFDRLQIILGGGPTQSEEECHQPPDRVRIALAHAIGGAGRLKTCPWLDDEQFAHGLRWVERAGNRVLVVNVGPTPAAIFRRCFAAAALPPVFEGNTTASIAMSHGRPYLHVGRVHKMGGEGPLAFSSLYPSAHVPRPDAEELAARCQRAASQVTEPLENWTAAATPPESLADFLAATVTGSGHELEQYFRAVAIAYSDPAHDRLRLGLAAVRQFI